MSEEFIANISSKLNLSKELELPDYEGYSLTPHNKTDEVLNFSPGPTALPEVAMAEIIKELLNDWSLGVTPLEISHRSPEFLSIKNNCEKLFKELLKVPDNYSLIWTHGGGHAQFSAVPLNLMKKKNDEPNYIVTGTWSNRSFLEAQKFCKPQASSEKVFHEVDSISTDFIKDSISKKSSYIYLCSNETINGLEFREDGLAVPSRTDTNNKIMVVDMSRDILSKRINWDNIDIAFAWSPKNFGFPCSSVVIINNDILDDEYKNYNKNIPSVLDWKLINNSDSFWNTLPVFNIYVTEKILNYYKEIGGIEKLEEISKTKAEIIYSILDDYDIYQPLVAKDRPERSRMNIPFYIKNKETMLLFLKNAYINNIVGLRTKTPFSSDDKPEALRISLYNSITIEDTIILAVFMKKFAKLVG